MPIQLSVCLVTPRASARVAPTHPAADRRRYADLRSMRLSHHRLMTIGLLSLFIVACTIDHTITHGADGSPEWDRRLRSAVAIGAQIEDAQAVLVRNGFKCNVGPAKPETLVCDKVASNSVGGVRRRWHATVEATDQRVSRVESSTELVRE